MNSPDHEFVTVEMRGLKSALAARAKAERVSVSAVVRRAVERELGLVDAAVAATGERRATNLAAATVKLSIRLTAAEAEQLATGARRAGLSRGAFLAGLLAGVPSLQSGAGSRPDCIAGLTASSAELSGLSRNLHQLSSLLRQGKGQAAQEYRRMVDTLGHDVRGHLRLAAGVLADLRPARLPAASGAPARPAAS